LKQLPPAALLLEALRGSQTEQELVGPETTGLLLNWCRAIHFAVAWLATVEAISVS